MSRLTATIPLRIARTEKVAADIHLFELRHPGDAELPGFTAGAHVTVKSPNGSLRKYSLCFDLAGKAASFILIAGGIGITPLLAMARHLNRAGKPYRLYYLTRSPEATAFRAELQGEDFRGKVVIHCDGGDAAAAFDLWPILEKPSAAHVYCCGPRPLLEAVRDMTGHWPQAAIHFESFIDAGAAARPEDKPFTVLLAKSGERIVVPPGVSILEAMRSRGHEAPSSCESGTCGTCRTRLIAGEADHRDLVLMDDEKAGQIMICVSRAVSAEIEIER